MSGASLQLIKAKLSRQGSSLHKQLAMEPGTVHVYNCSLGLGLILHQKTNIFYIFTATDCLKEISTGNRANSSQTRTGRQPGSRCAGGLALSISAMALPCALQQGQPQNKKTRQNLKKDPARNFRPESYSRALARPLRSPPAFHQRSYSHGPPLAMEGYG